MARTRYTIVIATRGTGVVRRLTIGLRVAVYAVGITLSLPVLMGLGARWSSLYEIATLRSRTASLELENTSYRAATEALTSQIQALQTAVDDLGARSQIDPSAARAMDRLPPSVKERAVGGGTPPQAMMRPSALFSPSFGSAEDTFGMLRDLLKGLESNLTIVKKDVDHREALAAATPSIWPTHGWLSGSYGMRRDPFNGRPDFHSGLDISADKGRPVYATADGTVESVGRAGNYGNLLVIKHGFGIMTRYGHLSSFVAQPGQKVKKGELIAFVGATGRATGSHLHYEVTVNGRILNPLQLLFSKPTS
jgi:murein DD-endopeptidase MepM/ murein hydrolase activator NlpD